MSKKPSVELKLPILKDMELVATQTAEIVASIWIFRRENG